MKKYFAYIILAVILVIGGIYYTASDRNKNINTPENKDSGQPVAQSHRSYDVQVTSDIANIRPGQLTTIGYKIVNDKNEVVKDFTVAHEKIMHFILVRKDLQHFQHLHPDFNEQTGEFIVKVTFPADGPYQLYPDFTPTDENPQKLPVTESFDLNVGDVSKYQSRTTTPDTATSKTVGGLTVDYFFGSTPRVGSQLDYGLTISDPNSDEQVQLETYLGAMGHSVILKEGSLDFIHTHALGMEMEGMEGMTAAEHAGHQGEPDTVDFSTTFSEPGTYKIFTQFQYKSKVYTSEYTISVN